MTPRELFDAARAEMEQSSFWNGPYLADLWEEVLLSEEREAGQ